MPSVQTAQRRCRVVVQMSLESGLMHSFLGMHRIGAPREVDLARLCGEIPHKCSLDSSAPRPRDGGRKSSAFVRPYSTEDMSSKATYSPIRLTSAWCGYALGLSTRWRIWPRSGQGQSRMCSSSSQSNGTFIAQRTFAQRRTLVYLRVMKCGGGRLIPATSRRSFFG
jgi:hypothetical protein